MTVWMLCPECGEQDNITSVHDTLYICNECSEQYNPEMIYGDKMSLVRERLAAIEHKQWMDWAETLMEEENLSDERVERWEQYMVPYDELDEETKEYDREYADDVLEVFMKNFDIEGRNYE